MFARHFHVLARRKPLRMRFVTTVLFLTLILATASSSPGRGQGVNYTGRWTPPHTTNGIAIHLTLLPGDSTLYHSEILWWTGANDAQGPFEGGLWGWQPLSYDCSSFPGTNMFQGITLPAPAGGVFCGSDSHLATAAGTQLFVAGGTQPGTENGVRHVYVFNPRNVSWSQVDSMSEERWYATSTALSDSRQLVLSGSKDLSLDFFGGLRNSESEPRDRGLFRYGIGTNGHAENPVYSGSSDWPTPRQGHTMVRNGPWRMFGGRDSLQYFNDYWELSRADTMFGPDFNYKWKHYPNLQNPPLARRGHTAVETPDPAAEMIIFGGIAKDENGDSVAVADVWRLWNNPEPGHGYEWVNVAIHFTTDTLGARCGHMAFYDATDRRMLVFGGRDSPTGTPSDSALWSLDFDDSSFNTATWHKLGAVGPSPRYDHAGVYDPGWIHTGTVDSSYAFVFGGQLANGGKANDLWQLRVQPAPAWRKVDWLQGTAPSPRSRHTLGAVARRLYVFGGRSADDTVYVARPEPLDAAEQRTWSIFSRHTPALTGHTAIVEDVQWSRIPEVYNPDSSVGHRWTRLENAPKKLNWYPQTFVCAADTVFVAGPDVLSYKLSLSGQHWSQFPATSSGFVGGSAVMYRPGKVMKCGSRDIEVSDGSDAVGTTKNINLSAGGAAQWESSGDMRPRVNHNLVLLPNGKVLVVGGTAKGGSDTTAQRRPQIWDPDAGNGAGAWFGGDTLAVQPLLRDYHSTAVLLPDGRVMSAGGNADSAADKKVEIFCPPYLFNSNGLAVRPGLVEAPRLVRYGSVYDLCRTSSDNIDKVSLLRPGAVTHGFDENQRFLSLDFTPRSATPPHLNVTFPSSPVDAPPGDYLLFVLNAQGVPSIAKWVRLFSSSDTTAPDSVANLTCDVVGTGAVHLTWTAPGDDGATGTAARVDLRYSPSPITADNFCQAAKVDSVIPPGSGGSARQYGVNGLGCNTYYFAMKYWDEANNVSAFGDTAIGTPLCGDCCESEVRAHLGGEGRTSARAGGRPEGTIAPNAAAPMAAATGLVAEATPGPGGLDLKLYAVADAFEGHAVASDGGVLLQRPDGAGSWSDRLGYELPAGSRFALCAPPEPTRWVFLAPCTVTGLLPAVSGDGGAWRLDSARHSTLGDVTAALADSVPRLGAGDTLLVHYAAMPDTAAASKGWMLMLNRASAEAGATRGRRLGSPEGAALPAAFALLQSRPNPFAEWATIRFTLLVASPVRLDIYDLLGRRVRTLVERSYEAGEHEVVWDRRTTDGVLAAPGLYFYRMQAGEFRARRAMMIVP